jgi:hypothetical protein
VDEFDERVGYGSRRAVRITADDTHGRLWEECTLVVIRMGVAPRPVISLRLAVLLRVHAIGSVILHKVASIGMVFTVIPVVIIVMIPVEYSNL